MLAFVSLFCCCVLSMCVLAKATCQSGLARMFGCASFDSLMIGMTAAACFVGGGKDCCDTPDDNGEGTYGYIACLTEREPGLSVFELRSGSAGGVRTYIYRRKATGHITQLDNCLVLCSPREDCPVLSDGKRSDYLITQ